MLKRVLPLVESDRAFGALLLLIIAGWMLACSSGAPAAPPENTEAVEAPAPEPATPTPGPEGAFRSYAYTSLQSPDGTMFFFEPLIPGGDDELLMAAMRHVVTEALGVTGRLSTRVAGPAMRFIAGSGIYDVTPIRESEGGPVSALLVQERH